MKKILIKLVGIFLAVVFVAFCLNINYNAVLDMPRDICLTLDDLEDMNKYNTFGSFTTAEISDNIFTVGGEKKHNTSLYIKLFGILPIRRVNVSISDKAEVYLGGIPLGFTINTRGLIVVGENGIGGKNPFKTGDIITKIDGVVIEKPEDVAKILSNDISNPKTITLIRNGENKEVVVFPVYDDVLEEYKLGLWVRCDAQGIGTLTFVTKDGKFGALGHAICDYETGVEIPVLDGGVYLCNLVGINKASRGKTGELRCLFSQTKAPSGDVLENTNSGVFGKTDDKSKLVDENLTAVVGSRMLVKLGGAKIISAVSGIREQYDIEIIKVKYQPKTGDKSFVFRVIDKRLISITGGIVQGMSGSPILQNGKLIGAVTHVFINDATKGYGIYMDWMMDEI